MCPKHCIIFSSTSVNKFWILISALSIPVAVRSKAQVCSLLIAGISCSNLAGHGCSSVVFIVCYVGHSHLIFRIHFQSSIPL
jgi:hypothetical protein